jgi:putative ABC transport system ATP-binding protein
MAMIELDTITKIYRMGKVDVPALRGVTLKIDKGEMLSIVGASGSGTSRPRASICLMVRMSAGLVITS